MSDLDFDDFVFNKLISDKERDHIKLMVSDYSALLDGLNDDNPHFRLAATEILKSHWNLPVEQQRSVFGRLFDDSFELVRCMAYDYWGSTFRCTKDKAACSHLAKIALDKTKSNRERRELRIPQLSRFWVHPYSCGPSKIGKTNNYPKCWLRKRLTKQPMISCQRWTLNYLNRLR